MNHEHKQPENILFEVGETTTYKNRLLAILEFNNLRSLTIQITSNKGWILFSNVKGISDNSCEYDYKTKLGTLPDEFSRLVKLEDLNISYLGIETLPESIVYLSSLKSLDISFNRIRLSNEVQKIKRLSNLEVLKIYGCNFTEEELKELSDNSPNLKVLYTEKHLITDFNLGN